MRGLRILALAPYPPNRAATNGGARVMGELLGRLAERHEVSVLALRGPGEPPGDEALPVEEVARPPVSGVWRRRALRLRGLPLWVAEWDVREYRRRLERLLAGPVPDLVVAHYHVMGQYLRDVTAPRVLVEYEAGARGAARFEGAAWRRYETRLLRSVDAAVALTEADAAALRALEPSARIVTIPFGIPLPPEPADAAGDGDTVLFVGNFEHEPNVDAALRLARSILPRLGSARLCLVGSRPPDDVRALASDRVEVHGSVADVAPFLARASVVALPLRHGGGMRVKTLEALAAGKAVVATPLALEGVGVVDGQQALVAETDEELAAAIAALLADPERRRALGRAARAWAEENAGWDARIAEHEALYRSLVAA